MSCTDYFQTLEALQMLEQEGVHKRGGAHAQEDEINDTTVPLCSKPIGGTELHRWSFFSVHSTRLHISLASWVLLFATSRHKARTLPKMRMNDGL
jgi:hypothetical protein